MATDIILIRHGETDWNRAHRWQGFADIPLNDTGRAQAHAAAKALLARNEGPIDHIISSDLSRAADTARIIAQHINVPLRLDERWREVNVGAWEGKTGDEIQTDDPEGWAAFISQPYTLQSFPNGETRAQSGARAVAALSDLQREFVNKGIVVVTHGGIIGYLLQHLLQIDRRVIGHIENCSLTHLRYHREQWVNITTSSEA